MAGWIKLHRSLTSWEWYADINTCRLFLHLLVTANRLPVLWRNCVIVQPGERLSSLEILAAETGLTVMQVRTSLRKLETTGEITRKTTNRFTVFQVQNWEKYQADNTPDNTQHNAENNNNTRNKEDSFPPIPPAGAVENAQQKQPKTQIPETDADTEKPTCFTFSDFWEIYGKKIDKLKCARKYAKLPEKDRAAIKAALPVYVSSTPELQFRKNPYTWLNGRCWGDEMQRQPDRNKTAPANANGGQVLHDYTFAENESGSGKADWEA